VNKKSLAKKGIFIVTLFIIIIIAMFIVVKYQVEGEKDMPFYIEKILITSMVDGEAAVESQNLWDINISGSNDVYIYISKKDGSKEAIKNIVIDNFKINSAPKVGNLRILRPTGDLKNLYQYSVEDYLDRSIEYIGEANDDLKSLQINNKGGIVAFRAELEDLGNYISNEDEQIIYDGNLLGKINVTLEDIKSSISFDVTIKISNNISYKTTITIDLPVGDLITNGNSSVEITNLEELIFKRV